MKLRNEHRFALAMLALAGAALTASALYVPIKAQIGQAMLEAAWRDAQEVPAAGDPQEAAKPWSWADMTPVAKLRFPRLGESQIILSQASGEGMAWGPGHVAGTAPLGAPGLSAAAAHRDTHFAILQEVRPGDLLELELLDGRVLQYRVSFGQVVDSTTWRFPDFRDGPDILALSTCWPFDSDASSPERFVLFADRVVDAGSGGA